MPSLVLLVGVLVTGVSLYLMLQPAQMAGLLDRVFGTRWRYAAALLRLLLGAALLASADSVAWSAAVELFGWLFVLGGLGLVAIPAPPLRRMAGWFGALSPTMTRLWLSLALLFGLFFICAALA
ncbi:MAG: hypothetical protein GWP63_12015 [Haliea sp.]|jgi:hypothetical protein|nr:hypothetical protein [Haliea sp.]